ncbi:MAG: hypothetical protein LKG19_11040 [Saprospiraceae bacterium]|jgi:hypothetical protein|nr:hypothetical protein [Saprospiraceae bacterium]
MKYKLIIILGMLTFLNNPTGFCQSLSKEVGIRIGGYGGYSFVFKKEQSENKFRRVRINAGKIDFKKNNNIQSYNLLASVTMGIEKRASLTNNFYIFHGWEPGLTFGFSGDKELKSIQINPFVGYVFGFMYNLNDKFIIGIETLPNIYINTSINPVQGEKADTNLSAGFDFNSNLIALNLAYRF